MVDDQTTTDTDARHADEDVASTGPSTVPTRPSVEVTFHAALLHGCLLLGSTALAARTTSPWRALCAEKKAKTAEKGGDAVRKQVCPTCSSEIRVVQFAGAGPRGFFWVCEKAGCGYTRRTR